MAILIQRYYWHLYLLRSKSWADNAVQPFFSRKENWFGRGIPLIENSFIYHSLLSRYRFIFLNFQEVVDEDIRPTQLSFEMAPTRSGFHWRVEALNASLWSALIQGKKLWGLYPPSKYYVPGALHFFFFFRSVVFCLPFDCFVWGGQIRLNVSS